MNSRFPIVLLALAGGLFTVESRAQPSRSLSEREAVAAAVSQNPTLHVALLQAQQSRYSLSAEQALYVPVFDASAGYTRSRTPSLVGPTYAANGALTQDATTRISGGDVVDVAAGLTKPFASGTVLSATLSGQRSSRTTLEQQALLGASGPGYALVGRLSATQPLLRGYGSDVGLASLRQAKLNLTANQLAARAAASTLLSQVVSAYWELWYSAEALHINEASRELAKTQKAQAEQQVASGALAPASALPYSTQVAVLEETVSASRTDLRQRMLALSRLLGNAANVSDDLSVGDAPSAPLEDEPPLDAAVSEALRNSYARKQLGTQLDILKDQLRIAGDPLRPRLDLDAYVQAQGLGNRRVPPALEQFGQFDAVSAHVGVTFEMPVTDTRRQSQIQAAKLAAHAAEKQLQANELELRTGVASAIALRRAARERLELATETERIAHDQVDAERARFQAGGSIAITVQQAEDSYRQAQLRVQRARVDLMLADLSLLELRGLLLERYADAVNLLPAESRGTLTSSVGGNF